MSIATELERLDEQRPLPPPMLYKYVVPDRVDVLANARIRFTPPLNTNDVFEVRQTFDLIAGPKMVSLLRELAPEADFEEPLRGALDELGLHGLSNEQAKALVAEFGGYDLEAAARGMLDQFIDRVPEHLNSPEYVDRLLQRMATEQLLLSLSEDSDSSPMWAPSLVAVRTVLVPWRDPGDEIPFVADCEKQGERDAHRESLGRPP